jgi:hypothetical protein
MFLIQNGLKQGDVLSPLLFNFVVEYTIRKVQENQEELKLNGKHKLLSSLADANLLGENINIVKRNTKTLLDAIGDVGLEVNAEKIKFTKLPYLAWRMVFAGFLIRPVA